MRVTTLQAGTVAPALPGVDFAAGPTVLWFFKVTCPVCQMAAPVARALADAYPGRVVGIGQDPPEKLAQFDRTYGLGLEAQADLPPYALSNAYGITVVPTLFVVGADGAIRDSVESWDRDGYGRVTQELGEMLEADPADLGAATAGLPVFRPG